MKFDGNDEMMKCKCKNAGDFNNVNVNAPRVTQIKLGRL